MCLYNLESRSDTGQKFPFKKHRQVYCADISRELRQIEQNINQVGKDTEGRVRGAELFYFLKRPPREFETKIHTIKNNSFPPQAPIISYFFF